MAVETERGLVPWSLMGEERALGLRGIPLRTRAGEVRAVTVVDVTDFTDLNRWRWSLHPNGYAQRGETRDGRRRTILMQRQLLGLDFGDTREGDHRNRNRLDNRRSNLRIVPDRSAQLQNQTPRGPLPRGVAPNGSGFRALATLRGKAHHIGTYSTVAEAADAAAKFRAAHMPFATD